MTVSAHDVATELRLRLPDARAVKIHKLLYYCQGWHLAWTGKPLFAESVEAWANGPVVKDLWADEKHGRKKPPPAVLPSDGLSVIGYVVGRYGQLTAKQLIQLTHSEAPWRDATERESVDGWEWNDQIIDHQALIAFFSNEPEQAELARHAEVAVADLERRGLLNVTLAGPGRLDNPAEIARRLTELAS
jgi:uncharacterized phage-associated protein